MPYLLNIILLNNNILYDFRRNIQICWVFFYNSYSDLLDNKNNESSI
uniref:Uncharacterized protein n=1 Tax=viral metagenome TaxID=1070528 RepID=A0A6C0HP04_9ZZZZ